MSEHEHYDRRKKKMASLLKAYVESGDPQLGEKLSSILETARAILFVTLHAGPLPLPAAFDLPRLPSLPQPRHRG